MERRYAEAERVVLVCHSLGGLIARRYLLDEYEHKGSVNSRVTDLLLYGTPNNASNLKKVARYLSWFHPQLRRLCRDSDFLLDLNHDWDTLGIQERIRVLAIVGGKDDAVGEESARELWGDVSVKVVTSASHVDLVKPTGSEDLRYRVLKNALRTAAMPVEPASTDDYLEALPQLANVLREATTPFQELNAEKKQAIRTVRTAVEKTQLHLQEIRAGRARPSERNSELVSLWSDAALETSAFDEQLARRLRQKAEYWNVPANWTDSECEHAGIMMDYILNSSRELFRFTTVM